MNTALATQILASHNKPKPDNVNSFYEHFSKVAEDYLIQASRVSHQKFAGRGLLPKLVKEPRFCPQGKAGIGCESVFLRKSKRLLRRLVHLQYFLQNDLANSWKVDRLWDNIIANQRFLLTISNHISSRERPSLDALIKMIHDVQESVRKGQAAEVSKRVNIARAKFRHDWTVAPSKIYAKVDTNVIPPTFILQKSDGQLTGNFLDYSQLLFDAWLPIFDKYSHQPEPSWDAFENRYSSYFADPVDTQLRPFTVSGLRAVLQKMKIRSAVGPDFWSVADLKNLPDEIFGLLPSLFNCVEATRCWPDAMVYGFCSLIPKKLVMFRL